jgi:hypothetical protein
MKQADKKKAQIIIAIVGIVLMAYVITNIQQKGTGLTTPPSDIPKAVWDKYDTNKDCFFQQTEVDQANTDRVNSFDGTPSVNTIVAMNMALASNYKSLYCDVPVIVCSLDSQCGTPNYDSTFKGCDGRFAYRTGKLSTPRCVNPNTATAYCTLDISYTNTFNCNYGCTESTGCDLVITLPTTTTTLIYMTCSQVGVLLNSVFYDVAPSGFTCTNQYFPQAGKNCYYSCNANPTNPTTTQAITTTIYNPTTTLPSMTTTTMILCTDCGPHPLQDYTMYLIIGVLAVLIIYYLKTTKK